MNLMRRWQQCGVGLVAGAAVLAGLAAWSGQNRIEWEHGEFRAAKTIVDLEFSTAAEVQKFVAPRDISASPTRSRVYALDLLDRAGWQLLDVSQTDREWVYLLRRAR